MALSSVSQKFSATSDLVLGIVIVVSNSILLLTFAVNKQLHKKEFILMGGIATFDLMYGLSSLGEGIQVHYHLFTNTHTGNISLAARMFLSSARHTNPMANLGYLSLSIDRVLACLYYRRYLKLGPKYAFTMLGLASSYGVGSTFVCIFVLCFYVSPSTPWPALEVFFVPPFLLSKVSVATCILCAYLSVSLYLIVCFGHKRMIKKGAGAKDRQLERQKRLNKTVGVLVLFTLFCEAVPLTIIALVESLGIFRPVLFSLTRVNCFVSICVLYWRQPKVRAAIKRTFGKDVAVVSVANVQVKPKPKTNNE